MYSIVDGVSNTRLAIDSFLQIIMADGFQNSVKLLPDLAERIQNIESKNPIFLNAIDIRLQNLERNHDTVSSEFVVSGPSSSSSSLPQLTSPSDLTSPEKDKMTAHVMVEIDKCKHDVYNYVMESLSLYQSETLSPVQVKMDNLGQAVQILSEVVFDIQKSMFNEEENSKENIHSPLDPSSIIQKNKPFHGGLESPLLSFPPCSPNDEVEDKADTNNNNNISKIDKRTPGDKIIDDIFSDEDDED